MSARNFLVSEAQQKSLKDWLTEEVYPEVIKQKGELQPVITSYKLQQEEGRSHEGAIGGALKYNFTPTSLGDILIVEYGGFQKDLTDYDNW